MSIANLTHTFVYLTNPLLVNVSSSDSNLKICSSTKLKIFESNNQQFSPSQYNMISSWNYSFDNC